MERRPWQIWASYAVCVLVAVGVLGWLSKMVVRLGQAEAMSEAKADIDERVGAALWRMDVALAQLLATEAARPVLAYQPLIAANGAWGAEPGPSSIGDGGKIGPGQGKGAKGKGASDVSNYSYSPLLVRSSDLVLLHFEADEAGCWISPQCPTEDAESLAVRQGVTPEDLDRNRKRLKLLEVAVNPATLLGQLDDSPIRNDISNTATNYAFHSPAEVYLGSPANARLSQGPLLAQLPNQPPILPQSAQQQQTQQADFPTAPNAFGANGEQAVNQFDAPQQMAEPSPQSLGGRGANQKGSKTDNRIEDYRQRFQSLQTATQQAMLNQNTANGWNHDMLMQAPDRVTLTRSQPIWSEGRLLLVRQVESDTRRALQGCWLDWPTIREQLLEQISDLLPNAELEPVLDTKTAPVSRMLATLPVQLVPPLPIATPRWNSSRRIALWLSWGSLAIVAAMLALLLNGVLQLSERRASFVSAVTHELRTPLTTFRMYSEMLAEGMVAEEKRQGYLETLRGEADRLGHLVENVLHYARLERSNRGWETEPVAVSQLVDAIASRLDRRAADSGLGVRWNIPSDLSSEQVCTNISALEQILFNLVDNACKYASPSAVDTLEISVTREGTSLGVHVRDFGPGIAADVRRRMFQPFSRTEEVGPAPGVGLGLALCRRLAGQLKARLHYVERDPGAEFVVLVPLA